MLFTAISFCVLRLYMTIPQINPQVKWWLLLYYGGLGTDPWLIAQKTRHLWVLFCSSPSISSQLRKKKWIFINWGVEEPRIGAIKYVAFEGGFCAYLWGKKQLCFFYEALQLIRQSEDSSFFPVFLLKWIRHFVFHKIIMQPHSTFFSTPLF